MISKHVDKGWPVRKRGQCPTSPGTEMSTTFVMEQRLHPIERLLLGLRYVQNFLRRRHPREQKTKKKRDKIAIMHEIYYLWRILRGLCLLPATFTETGYISFSWTSWVTLLTVSFWAVMAPYAAMVCYLIAAAEIEKTGDQKEGLQEFSQMAAVTIVTMFEVYVPVPLFLSMRSFTKLTYSWERMEIKYLKLTGSPPKLGIKPLTYGLFVITQVYSVILLVGLHDQIGWPFWMMLPFTHAVLCTVSITMVWVSGYVAIAVLAYDLARRTFKDCEAQGVTGLRRHRLLWLHIVKLLHTFHSCWSAVQAPLIFWTFVISTLYFFNFIRTLMLSWDGLSACVYSFTILTCKEINLLRKLGQNLLVWIACAGCLFFVCFSAQIATESVTCARQTVLRLPLSRRGAFFQNEAFTFLEEMREKQLSLTLNGFIAINRSRVITMMVVALTYCIVLSQFTLLK
ncbi:uncharacterized protein LOC113211663 [Frankliniella occidentalis]|uniref:Uncharacterized protein LOC113211663 n=1 Tax=Frankliniella occidentalis TaxID=133901 RepID=A0A9C6TS74_FRAOC|nr:uncharacterized protein LOC113211663 [Frankliniella occidentalis]